MNFVITRKTNVSFYDIQIFVFLVNPELSEPVTSSDALLQI